MSISFVTSGKAPGNAIGFITSGKADNVSFVERIIRVIKRFISKTKKYFFRSSDV